MPEESQSQQEIARQRVAEIVAQFPDRFDDAEIEELTERVTHLIGNIEALRAVPVVNSDELATAFRPIGKEQT